MPGTASIVWNPSRLNAGLSAAFRTSAVVAAADATTHNPARRIIGVKGPVLKGTTATIVGTGLARVFEHGRKGGYPILPGGAVGPRKSKVQGVYSYKTRSKRGGTGTALHFRGTGGFAAYAIGGPMRAQPFLAPAAARWASIYYQQAARGALASFTAGSLSRGLGIAA